MRMRKAVCVGASVASIGALALKLADTPTQRIYFFFFLPLSDALRLGQA